jgi:hypothetical protein
LSIVSTILIVQISTLPQPSAPNFHSSEQTVDVLLMFRALSKTPISKLELSIMDSSAAKLVRTKGQDSIVLPFDLSAGTFAASLWTALYSKLYFRSYSAIQAFIPCCEFDRSLETSLYLDF